MLKAEYKSTSKETAAAYCIQLDGNDGSEGKGNQLCHNEVRSPPLSESCQQKNTSKWLYSTTCPGVGFSNASWSTSKGEWGQLVGRQRNCGNHWAKLSLL